MSPEEVATEARVAAKYIRHRYGTYLRVHILLPLLLDIATDISQTRSIIARIPKVNAAGTLISVYNPDQIEAYNRLYHVY